MSAPLAIGGWLAALGSTTAARVLLARRMQLVARACHELRGPLTSARLALELASRRPDAPRAPLQAIDLELDRAGLALADLSAARHGARAPDRHRTFALGELLQEVAREARADAWRLGGQLELDWREERVLLRGDPIRLRQALLNLVANALRHGGGRVVVRACASANVARIEVLDEGPGLPATVAELVRRPSRGLHGHGLACAFDIAASHGGRLASAPSERGARLVLELPTAR
jgi:signal transduction histidine kinase